MKYFEWDGPMSTISSDRYRYFIVSLLWVEEIGIEN